jgi:predicted HD phosphohydrolase
MPSFHAMTEGSVEHWQLIAQRDAEFARGLPDRMLAQLRLLRDDCHGFAVDRLEHCLQSATRAQRDGRDEEYVLCALLHDVGAALAPANHAEFIAMILRPYISEKNFWMLLHHAIFQGYHFFHFFGMDRNARDRFREHPHYAYTAEFCERYDQNCFDPDYPSLPLESFEPLLRRLLSTPRR